MTSRLEFSSSPGGSMVLRSVMLGISDIRAKSTLVESSLTFLADWPTRRTWMAGPIADGVWEAHWLCQMDLRKVRGCSWCDSYREQRTRRR